MPAFTFAPRIPFLLAVASGLVMGACGPTSTSTPTQSAPSSAPAKPDAAPKAAAPATEAAAPAKPAGSSALDAYYQKARSGGEIKVTHYGAGLEGWEPVVEAFRRRYPDIQVELSLQRAPETIQRLTAEATSGKQIANVVSHGETAMLTLDQQAAFTEWEGPPTVQQLPKIPATAGVTRWPINESIHGMVVNTSLVPPEKFPQTPQSFLDPFFKGVGKLLMEDPRSTGPALDFFTQAYDKFGQDYLDRIKDQDVTFTRDRVLAPQQVARGEYAVYFPVSLASQHFELQKVAPVKVDILREMATTTTTSIAVIKRAPAQDAAKLYVAWLLSEEGQHTLVEKKEQFAALPGVPPPAGWPNYTDLKLARRTEEQVARNAEYTDLFERQFFR